MRRRNVVSLFSAPPGAAGRPDAAVAASSELLPRNANEKGKKSLSPMDGGASQVLAYP